MKNAIAIAIAKVRKKTGIYQPEPRQSLEIDEEISRTGLGILLIAGAVVGMGGFICLIGGIIHSGGVVEFLRGWFSALGGI